MFLGDDAGGVYAQREAFRFEVFILMLGPEFVPGFSGDYFASTKAGSHLARFIFFESFSICKESSGRNLNVRVPIFFFGFLFRFDRVFRGVDVDLRGESFGCEVNFCKRFCEMDFVFDGNFSVVGKG